jgi:hypothetical protein
MLGLALGFALGTRSVLGIADARSGPPPGRRAARTAFLARACVSRVTTCVCIHASRARDRCHGCRGVATSVKTTHAENGLPRVAIRG